MFSQLIYDTATAVATRFRGLRPTQQLPHEQVSDVEDPQLRPNVIQMTERSGRARARAAAKEELSSQQEQGMAVYPARKIGSDDHIALLFQPGRGRQADSAPQRHPLFPVAPKARVEPEAPAKLQRRRSSRVSARAVDPLSWTALPIEARQMIVKYVLTDVIDRHLTTVYALDGPFAVAW